jgi:DNA-directed RNA polymerase subunit E'/Rpb7
MLLQKQIRRIVNLQPQFIGSNIYEHLKVQVEKDICEECNNENGFITNVISIDKIVDNYIENSSSDIMVEVDTTVSIFKPTAGMIVNGKVKAIYNDGILAEIYERQRVLIPSSTYQSCKATIGSTLSLRISAVRYNNHVFSCLAVIA